MVFFNYEVTSLSEHNVVWQKPRDTLKSPCKTIGYYSHLHDVFLNFRCVSHF